MNLDLDRTEIMNLIAALNAIEVKGRDSMLTVLRLMQKLEAALKPEETKDAPE